MKNFFITGGAGFISNKIIKKLIDHNKITVYDNFSRDTLTSSDVYNHPNLSIITGDILNYKDLYAAMSSDRFNVVIHAAAIAGINSVIEHPVETMKVNIVGTANVLECCRELDIQDRVVDFSTSEIFGSIALHSCENDQAVVGAAGEPRWVYSASKLAGEHLAKAYHTEYGLPTVTVRPFNIYGPGQSTNGALQIFIERALRNDDIYINGSGDQIRAWCFVDDFVDCLIKCIESPHAVGNSFNIGNSKESITMIGLAKMICRLLKSNSKIIFKEPLSADVAIRIPNTEKIKNILGFESQIDLEEGILKTAEYIKNKWKGKTLKTIL